MLTATTQRDGKCVTSSVRRDCRRPEFRDSCNDEFNFVTKLDVEDGKEIIGTYEINSNQVTYTIRVDPKGATLGELDTCGEVAICAAPTHVGRCRSCAENSKLVLVIYNESPTTEDLLAMVVGERPNVPDGCRYVYSGIGKTYYQGFLDDSDNIELVRSTENTSTVTYLTTCEQCNGQKVARFDECVTCSTIDDAATYEDEECACPAGKYPHFDCSDDVFDINWLVATSQMRPRIPTTNLGPNFNPGNGYLSPIEAQNTKISDYCSTSRVSGSLKPTCLGRTITHDTYGEIPQSVIDNFCKPHLTSCLSCPKGMYKSQVSCILSSP